MRPKTRSRHNRAADNYFAKTGAIIVFGNVKIGSLFQAGSEAGVWYDGRGWRLRFLVTQTEQLRVTFRCAKPKTFAGQSPLISVSQLFMTERGGPAQQGGGRL